MEEVRLATSRLLIREFRKEDACVLPWTSDFFDSESARDFVANAIEARGARPRRLYHLAIDLTESDRPESGRLIGAIEFQILSSHNETAEVGYWIAPSCQRRGYATEAVRALCVFAFEHLPIYRIQATSAPQNEPSHSVLFRSGFLKEGVLRGNMRMGEQRQDSHLFSRLRTDTV